MTRHLGQTVPKDNKKGEHVQINMIINGIRKGQIRIQMHSRNKNLENHDRHMQETKSIIQASKYRYTYSKQEKARKIYEKHFNKKIAAKMTIAYTPRKFRASYISKMDLN